MQKVFGKVGGNLAPASDALQFVSGKSFDLLDDEEFQAISEGISAFGRHCDQVLIGQAQVMVIGFRPHLDVDCFVVPDPY